MSRGQRLLLLTASAEPPSLGRRARGRLRCSGAVGGSRSAPRHLPGLPGAQPRGARRGPARYRRCLRGGGRGRSCRGLGDSGRTESTGGAGYPHPAARAATPVGGAVPAAPTAGLRLPRVLPRKEKLTHLGQGWRPLRRGPCALPAESGFGGMSRGSALSAPPGYGRAPARRLRFPLTLP